MQRFVGKFNAGSLAAIADEYDDEYVLDFPGGPAGHGKEGIRRAPSEFRTALPDLHFATDDLYAVVGHAFGWNAPAPVA